MNLSAGSLIFLLTATEKIWQITLIGHRPGLPTPAILAGCPILDAILFGARRGSAADLTSRFD